jgi:hypothetical protein
LTAVLCCAVLCCAVLCCAVLSCAVLCCAVLCCAVLFLECFYLVYSSSAVPLILPVSPRSTHSFYSQHSLFEQSSFDLFSNHFHFLYALHCTALHCTALHCHRGAFTPALPLPLPLPVAQGTDPIRPTHPLVERVQRRHGAVREQFYLYRHHQEDLEGDGRG